MTVHTAGIPSIVAINLAPAAADTGNPAGSVVVVERAIQRPAPSQRVGAVQSQTAFTTDHLLIDREYELEYELE